MKHFKHWYLRHYGYHHYGVLSWSSKFRYWSWSGYSPCSDLNCSKRMHNCHSVSGYMSRGNCCYLGFPFREGRCSYSGAKGNFFSKTIPMYK